MVEPRMKTMMISERNLNRLKKVGNIADTLNDAVTKVLDFYEKHEGVNK